MKQIFLSKINIKNRRQTMENNVVITIIGDYITGVGEFIVQLQTDLKPEQPKKNHVEEWDPMTQG